MTKAGDKIVIRQPVADECGTITQLCLRSKAHWGYNAAFLASCRDELSVSPSILIQNFTRVAILHGGIAGFVELDCTGKNASLEKLFVDPPAMGMGIGKSLLDVAAKEAREQGKSLLQIEADPDAAPFYQKMGAQHAGTAASGSIAGRSLPVLHLRVN